MIHQPLPRCTVVAHGTIRSGQVGEAYSIPGYNKDSYEVADQQGQDLEIVQLNPHDQSIISAQQDKPIRTRTFSFSENGGRMEILVNVENRLASFVIIAYCPSPSKPRS